MADMQAGALHPRALPPSSTPGTMGGPWGGATEGKLPPANTGHTCANQSQDWPGRQEKEKQICTLIMETKTKFMFRPGFTG